MITKQKRKINIQISAGLSVDVGLNGINSNVYVSNFALIIDTRASLNNRQGCQNQYTEKRRSLTVLFHSEYLPELREHGQICCYILVNHLRDILFYLHEGRLSFQDYRHLLSILIEYEMIDLRLVYSSSSLATREYDTEFIVK